MPLQFIRAHVLDFMKFAEQHPSMTFKVTQIGCGLAGYEASRLHHCSQVLPAIAGSMRHGNNTCPQPNSGGISDDQSGYTDPRLRNLVYQILVESSKIRPLICQNGYSIPYLLATFSCGFYDDADWHYL